MNFRGTERGRGGGKSVVINKVKKGGLQRIDGQSWGSQEGSTKFHLDTARILLAPSHFRMVDNARVLIVLLAGPKETFQHTLLRQDDLTKGVTEKSQIYSYTRGIGKKIVKKTLTSHNGKTMKNFAIALFILCSYNQHQQQFQRKLPSCYLVHTAQVNSLLATYDDTGASHKHLPRGTVMHHFCLSRRMRGTPCPRHHS